MASDDTYTWKAYNYTPSIVAAVIFCILFLLATLFCFYQFVRALASKHATKKEKGEVCTLIPYILGGICEIIGYIGRILSHSNENALTPYIIQSILLLVAPALFAATIYMTLGRLIRKLDCARYSIVPLKWLTKIFVAGDVLSFLMQGAGGGIMSSGNLSSVHTGENVIIGGLIVQLVFFGLFIVVEMIFHYRILKNPSNIAVMSRNVPSRFKNWNSILLTLLTCSLLIFVRSVFRLIEYAQGNDGYIISHEAFLYVFDGLLIFLNMVCFMSQNIGGFYVNFKFIKSENYDSFGLVEESVPTYRKS